VSTSLFFCTIVDKIWLLLSFAYFFMGWHAKTVTLPPGDIIFVQLACPLVSISPTFYEQLLRQNPFAKKLQTQIVSI
jgi:hypothetical protein